MAFNPPQAPRTTIAKTACLQAHDQAVSGRAFDEMGELSAAAATTTLAKLLMH